VQAQAPHIELRPVLPDRLTGLLFVTSAHDGSHRLFILEEQGRISAAATFHMTTRPASAPLFEYHPWRSPVHMSRSRFARACLRSRSRQFGSLLPIASLAQVRARCRQGGPSTV